MNQPKKHGKVTKSPPRSTRQRATIALEHPRHEAMDEQREIVFFREIFGTSYSWLFSGIHLFNHVIGHLVCFVPLMWVGYAGMPRRIQDYPYAYASWHSVASLGHTIVLLGLFSFLLLLVHAAFFKRPLKPRGHGMPFIVTRTATLILDKYFSTQTKFSKQLNGVRTIRKYINR